MELPEDFKEFIKLLNGDLEANKKASGREKYWYDIQWIKKHAHRS